MVHGLSYLDYEYAIFEKNAMIRFSSRFPESTIIIMSTPEFI
jgi:hypothetical protein